MGSPKIVIIKMKELIYTTVFAVLGVILIILLICMFVPKNKDAAPAMKYYPGIYSSCIPLDNQVISVEVKVNNNSIQSVNFSKLTDDLNTLYPLLQPTMSNIQEQMVETQNIEKVKANDRSKETTKYLLTALDSALSKAKIQ